MTTLLTLFGGILLVGLLYAAAAQVKSLPPAVRAALASGLPLLAYLIYVLGRWPGLDVVAIHVSVFVAAGFVLYVVSQIHRRGGRMHWAPRVLIGFFLTLAIINAGLLYVSTRGLPPAIAGLLLPGGGQHEIHSGFAGVVEHGEEAAKAVSSELRQAHALARLGWQIDIDGLGGESSPKARVVVRIRDRTGLPLEGLDVDYRLARPGAASPAASGVLGAVAPGEYAGIVELPAAGRWLVDVRVARQGQALYRQTLEVMRP